MRGCLYKSTFKKNILYIGDSAKSSTSRHRADALRRIGCDVVLVDPSQVIAPRRRCQSYLDYRTGFRFLQVRLLRGLQADAKIASFKPDLIWVNGGELIGPRVLEWLLCKFKCQAILYNNDDPTGRRDWSRFSTLRSSLSLYSLCVFCRPETALEALALGAQRTIRVFMSYDNINHIPSSLPREFLAWRAISFVGTFIPGEKRDRFLLQLMNAGLPLSLSGNGWRKSPVWNLIRIIYQGPGISGQAYAHSLSSSVASLGFLSHQNRDLLTSRTFEIPACRGLLCAERTSEHQLLFEHGCEALFWNSAPECIRLCNILLDDIHENECIRAAGHRLVHHLGTSTEDVCCTILSSI